MKKAEYTVDLIIDGKKIRTKGKDLILQIDGKSVYNSLSNNFNFKNEKDQYQVSAIKSLLRATNSAFGHIGRFKIVKSVSNSSKSFTEIKKSLNMTSATTDYHLKKLTDNLIIYKNEKNKYALTILGELVLNYFSNFLIEAENLQKMIES